MRLPYELDHFITVKQVVLTARWYSVLLTAPPLNICAGKTNHITGDFIKHLSIPQDDF